MIKILACLFMIIDHVGLIFFPQVNEFRIIGRLAMPLFAFCIARGFYFTYNKGTISTYKKRMFLFSIVSQVPYTGLCVAMEQKTAISMEVFNNQYPED